MEVSEPIHRVVKILVDSFRDIVALLIRAEKVVTIEAYAAAINKSREIARKELSDLAKKGFLKEMKVSRKYTYKLIPPVLKDRIIQYKD